MTAFVFPNNHLWKDILCPVFLAKDMFASKKRSLQFKNSDSGLDLGLQLFNQQQHETHRKDLIITPGVLSLERKDIHRTLMRFNTMPYRLP